MKSVLRLLPLALAACTSASALAQIGAGGRFDLAGPKIDVHVQRGAKSLPIAMVPNLQAGDKLTIHADLPATQSVKLLMVVTFLRGSTNPPPEGWFTKIATWDKKVRTEGVTVTVPQEAQQALIFLAPETGGDYSTLKSAVTGRPGVFVRAAQDLNEAAFEQARIERYVQAIRRVPPGSPAELLDHSHKLAATLNLKPNEDCFKRPADQQLSCLRQTGSQVLLDDGHGQTLAAMLANGDSANLIGAAAGTPMIAGAGAYSAYVGTVIDLVRLLSGLHTAQFQYIPAIAFPDDGALNLRLNTPPSFHNPKSVLVIALPSIQPSVPPPLRLQDPHHVSCLLQPSMVLPLEGAPLVFATSFAHDLTLHLNGATLQGKSDLPLVPDAYEGGLMLTAKADRKPLPMAAPEARDAAATPSEQVASESESALPTETNGDVQVTGTVRGAWGFDSFEGVTVPLQRRSGSHWSAITSELFAGRANDLSLSADGVACASRVQLDLPGNDDLPLQWKQANSATGGQQHLDVKLPLEKAAPGTVHLLVHQFGTPAVENVTVTAYSDNTRLQALHIHAGDSFATLSGTGLGNVRSIHLAGVDYLPAADQPAGGKDLRVTLATTKKETRAKTTPSNAGESGIAQALLTDGRTVNVPYSVDAARPSLQLLNRAVRAAPVHGLPLLFQSDTDLPLDAKISFALRSESSARFPRSEKIEIALADGSLHTLLSVSDGTLVLQDARIALVSFTPRKLFGDSAFGPLQLRGVLDDGTVSDWIPLGTLIRLPIVESLSCTRPPAKAANTATEEGTPDIKAELSCQIAGANLFLIDSTSAEAGFASAVTTPVGFAGDTLPVPRPTDSHTLYLRLRDDPELVVSIKSEHNL